jgi:small ligand-binding sensory domain FIST
LGRGEALFDVPNHDTQAFQSEVADVAVGGFFCNGEIGPVGGSTYLHGYTSAFGIVRPRASAKPNSAIS